jgi:hypothetical protein
MVVSIIVYVVVTLSHRARNIAIAACLHGAIVLAAALAYLLTESSRDDSLFAGIWIVLVSWSNKAVAPVSILLQLIFQLLATGRGDEQSRFSVLQCFGLQAVTMRALGHRWRLRLGRSCMDDPPQPPGVWHQGWFIRISYEWGFPFINYVALAMVYVVILIYCSVVA